MLDFIAGMISGAGLVIIHDAYKTARRELLSMSLDRKLAKKKQRK
jgi:hypothetical protein